MNIKEIFYSIPFVIDSIERDEFNHIAAWTIRIDFDDYSDVWTLADMRGWCRKVCQGKWRCISDRSAERAKFQFELANDSEAFFLVFAEDIVE